MSRSQRQRPGCDPERELLACPFCGLVLHCELGEIPKHLNQAHSGLCRLSGLIIESREAHRYVMRIRYLERKHGGARFAAPRRPG